MEQLEVLTPENGGGTTESSRNGIQASTGSRIRLVERRISKFEMQLQKMVSQKKIFTIHVTVLAVISGAGFQIDAC